MTDDQIILALETLTKEKRQAWQKWRRGDLGSAIVVLASGK